MLEPARLYVHNGKEIELYYYEETKDGCFERYYESTVNDEIFKMIDADLSFISQGRKHFQRFITRLSRIVPTSSLTDNSLLNQKG